MPKFTPLQILSAALSLGALIAGAMSQSEDIRSEVEEAVEKALDGRDAKLAKPPAKT